jgi:hypothetical protein
MRRLNPLFHLFAVANVLLASALATPAPAAEMTYQVINDSDRPLNLKLFARDDSHQQWPSRTKAFSVRPDPAIQQLKITCTEGQQICWGVWMTVQVASGEVVGSTGQRARRYTTTYVGGAGERGTRPCRSCCNICRDGAVTPAFRLRDPDPAAQ